MVSDPPVTEASKTASMGSRQISATTQAAPDKARGADAGWRVSGLVMGALVKGQSRLDRGFILVFLSGFQPKGGRWAARPPYGFHLSRPQGAPKANPDQS